MTGELVLTKAMSTALVLGFFALVIFFLRFLYGPKGMFRDPVWDKWNEEARQELEQEKARKEDEVSLHLLEERFLVYARGFYTGDAKEDHPLAVKEAHTLRVCAHAARLARAEAVFAGPGAHALAARSLRIAALFHDVARFSQYRRFHTFADELSVNHGSEGVRIIRAEGFLDREPPLLRRTVLAAVAMHNRKMMPARLGGMQRDVLAALRDADKLDIMRVLSDTLSPNGKVDDVVLMHLKNEPGAWSEPVLDALERKQVAAYTDMRFYNDFRILLCTWLFDLGFAETRRIIKEENHLTRLMAGLDVAPPVRARVEAVVSRELGSV